MALDFPNQWNELSKVINLQLEYMYSSWWHWTGPQVKAYHSAFYRPENLCIIVTGNVKPAEVLKAIEPIELKVIAKVSNGHGWK